MTYNLDYPADAGALWSSCRTVLADEGARAWLLSRGIDPVVVAVRDLARVLPGRDVDVPGWADYPRRKGYRIVLPLVDHLGVMRSVMLRTTDASARLKTLAPRGYTTAGLITDWQPLDLDRTRRHDVIVVEGEPDWLTWATRDVHARVIGYRPGSWSEEAGRAHATSIPIGSRVALRLDCDKAGEQYAATVAGTLWERSLWRLRAEADQDDNDRLRAGLLSADPFDGCVSMPAPCRPVSQLADDMATPELWADDRAREVLRAATDEVAAMGRGGRASTLNRRAFEVGVWAARGCLTATHAQDALLDAAVAAGLRRTEARGLIMRAWRKAEAKVATEPTFTRRAGVTRKARRRLGRGPVKAVAEAPQASTAAPLPEEEQELAPVITLPVARAQVGVAAARLLRKRGGAVSVLDAECAVGKSHASREALLDLLVEEGGRAVLRLPTQHGVAETLAAYRLAVAERGLELTVEQTPVRTEETCPLGWQEIQAAHRAHPRGAKEVCKRCPLYPTEDRQTECPYWAAIFAAAQADITIETHAVGQRTRADWSRGVEVDWRSVMRAQAAGGAWSARVKRTPTGARVDLVKDEPGGRELPALTSSQVWGRRWEQGSTLAMATWLGAQLGVMKPCLTLGDVSAAVGAEHGQRVWIDRAVLARAAGVGAGRPAMARLEERGGWEAGLHVVVDHLGEEAWGAPVPAVKQTSEALPDWRSREAIYAWLAAGWGVEASTVADLEAAVVDGRVAMERPMRALILDESPGAIVLQKSELTREDLHKLADAGDVDGAEALLTLTRLMTEAAEESTTMDGAAIAAALGDGQITVDAGAYRHGGAVMAAALEESTTAARLARMQAAADWRAVDGLAHALALGWESAYIDRSGVLHVGQVDPLHLDLFDATVALDATTDDDAVATLYGGAVEHVDVEVSRPEGLRVTWVPYDTGSRSHVAGEERPGRRRAGAVWLSAALRWGAGCRALHVTHKAWREDGWTAEVLRQLEAGGAHVIHHGGVDARGSNEHRACSTCVVSSFHIPRLVVLQDAQLGAHARGERWADYDDAARQRWIDASHRQLVTAQIIQAVGRVRYLEASEAAPKHIIFLDRRDPAAFGFEADEVIAPDQLALEELGEVPALDLDDDDVEARAAARAIMREVLTRVVDLHGGVYVPGCDADSDEPTRLDEVVQAQAPGRSEECARIAHWWQRGLYATGADYVHTRLRSWITRGLGGRWADVREATGLDAVTIEHDRPGQAWPTLCRAGAQVDRASLESQLAVRGARCYRLRRPDGVTTEQVWMRAAGSRLGEALARVRMDASQLRGLPIMRIYAELAAVVGRSVDTLRRWVREEALPGEGSGAALLRIWHDAAQLDRADVLRWVADTIRDPDAADPARRMQIEAALAMCPAIDVTGVAGSAVYARQLLVERMGEAPRPREVAALVAALVDDEEGGERAAG